MSAPSKLNRRDDSLVGFFGYVPPVWPRGLMLLRQHFGRKFHLVQNAAGVDPLAQDLAGVRDRLHRHRRAARVQQDDVSNHEWHRTIISSCCRPCLCARPLDPFPDDLTRCLSSQCRLASIALFIIFATAATLNANGVTDIQTSSQAAEALRPIAGVFTFALFAAGIIATGMLAVPVLAGSAAYGVSEVFGWTEGLDRRPREAIAFYATIAVATMGGVALNFTSLDPIKALYWSAVVNGVLAAPLMAVMMVIAMNPRIMGRFTLPRPMLVVGWIATLVMALATIGFFSL